MAKNFEEKKHNFVLPHKNSNVRIKLLSDIQYSASFKDKKLDRLEEELSKDEFDYICIPGDVLDSTNFLEENLPKRERILCFFEQIGKKHKTFISLGNHDFTLSTKTGWIADWNDKFWREVSSIEGVQVSHFNPYYEDDNVIIYMVELDFDYYYEHRNEGRERLISELKNYRHLLQSLDSNKTKIMMVHSPIYMSDPKVLELIKEYDLVLSGHMHNGMFPPVLDRLLKGNVGIIAPNKRLFPDNARGVKVMDYEGKKIYLIISGGITKLAECAGFSSKFNDIVYPMSIDDITVESKVINLKSH